MAGPDPSAPILDLTGHPLDPMRLSAVMCFPRDERKRRRLLASYLATVLCDRGERAKDETANIDLSLLRERCPVARGTCDNHKAMQAGRFAGWRISTVPVRHARF
ncbi:MAG: hypothetical protein ACREV4_15605 [Gammaproteobacteria bacterium]